MYRYLIIKKFLFQEENGRVKEQERAIEANTIAEAKLALVKEELQKEHEKNMQKMAVNPYFLQISVDIFPWIKFLLLSI